MGWLANQVFRLGCAVFAEQNQVFAAQIGAIYEVLGRAGTGFAFADGFGLVAEIDAHAVVEDIERAFPEALILESLAVAHDSTLNLVNLLEKLNHSQMKM